MLLNTRIEIVTPFLFLSMLNISARDRELHLTWHNDPFMRFGASMYFTVEYFTHFLCSVGLVTAVKEFAIIDKLIKISENESLPW